MASTRINWFKAENDAIVSLHEIMTKRGVIGEGQRFRLVSNTDGDYCLALERLHKGMSRQTWEVERTSSKVANARVPAVKWLQGYVMACWHLMGDTPGHEFWRS